MYALIKLRDIRESDLEDYVIEKLDILEILKNLFISGEIDQSHLDNLRFFIEGYSYQEVDPDKLLWVYNKLEKYFKSEGIINSYLEKYPHYRVIKRDIMKYTKDEELMCQF